MNISVFMIVEYIEFSHVTLYTVFFMLVEYVNTQAEIYSVILSTSEPHSPVRSTVNYPLGNSCAFSVAIASDDDSSSAYTRSAAEPSVPSSQLIAF